MSDKPPKPLPLTGRPPVKKSFPLADSEDGLSSEERKMVRQALFPNGGILLPPLVVNENMEHKSVDFSPQYMQHATIEGDPEKVRREQHLRPLRPCGKCGNLRDAEWSRFCQACDADSRDYRYKNDMQSYKFNLWSGQGPALVHDAMEKRFVASRGHLPAGAFFPAITSYIRIASPKADEMIEEWKRLDSTERDVLLDFAKGLGRR